MAAVAGARSSTLNPNAPVFIPAAFRQVEDFSPEWWEHIKTSAWFRDYWLSEHQEESFTADDDDGDAANLLLDSFDLGFDEEFLDLDTQFQEFLESESKGIIEETNQRNDTGFGISNNNDNVAKAVLRSLSLPKSPKEKSPKPRYFEKVAKCVSPRQQVRRIQQPR